jgi:hypothetical protein
MPVAPNDSLFPSLSFKQRFYGFLICAGLGVTMTIVGTIMLVLLKVKIFAALYSIGNLCTISSYAPQSRVEE